MPRIAMSGHAAQGGPAGVLDRDAVPDERWGIVGVVQPTGDRRAMTGQEGSQGRLLDRRATADSGGRPQSARRRRRGSRWTADEVVSVPSC